MPQSLAKILVHTVFSTKDRRPFLRDKMLREELHRYLGGILTNHDCQPIIVGGVESQRPISDGGATPMLPKKGCSGIVIPGPKRATIFSRSSGMILVRR